MSRCETRGLQVMTVNIVTECSWFHCHNRLRGRRIYTIDNSTKCDWIIRNRIVLKTVPFQIQLNLLQPSFNKFLLRRRVTSFLLHSHVIRQTVWSAERERERERDGGTRTRARVSELRVSVSIQSAEPCHTVMEIIAWDTWKLPFRHFINRDF